ncbi:uncharacterized protein DSM5745_10467 [Aspergillus mulundensis]|uniref:Uncharacterized protein n=1 Tax=Aspergillus mulundensis TaxID=1810919 RepID=A0A3D8QJ09_9EURO|nr:hypothetical protein DSM5745_10467 [Aspergillus mulundensis]RDW61795.1 hypothetical protein DSM5745_10467 [Aspergillus mulundensis]
MGSPFPGGDGPGGESAGTGDQLLEVIYRESEIRVRSFETQTTSDEETDLRATGLPTFLWTQNDLYGWIGDRLRTRSDNAVTVVLIGTEWSTARWITELQVRLQALRGVHFVLLRC